MLKLFSLLSVLLSSAALAQPGNRYDNTFGRYNGLELTRIDQGTGYQDMQVQPDGKPVCAGTYSTGLLSQPAVVRYKLNGESDSSFGVNGIAVSFLDNADVVLYAMCLQPDGKIVVAGYTAAASQNSTDFLLARYQANGYPDSSFGTNGFVTIDAGPFQDWLHDVKLQSNGKIAAAGYAFNGQHYVFAAVSLHGDGTPDSGFGNNGVSLIDANVGNSQCLGLALQPDDKMLLAGFSGDINNRSTFTVARLKQDGTADSSFGTNGVVYPVTDALSERLEDIIVLPNGDMVAIGEAIVNSTYQSDFTLVKLKANGDLFTDFGINGVSRINLWNTLSIPKKIVLQEDGKMIVTGYINSPNNVPGDVVLLRFNTNGTLDTDFDADGDIGNDGADPDNSFLATGLAISGQRIYVSGAAVPFPTSFPRSGFIIAAINTGLPVAVSLVYFSAERKEESVQVLWQTGENTGVNFVIERSVDGTHFEVAGILNATAEKRYRFTDAAALQTTCFYRVKMIERDGSYTYSSIAKVPGKRAALQLSLYPNPAKNKLSIAVAGIRGNALIKIADAGGNAVQQMNINSTGSFSINMDISKLTTGSYYLLLYSTVGLLQEKFVKL